METLQEQIRQADSAQIHQILEITMQRYRELFPEWEVIFATVQKTKSETEQIERMIRLLNSMKASPYRSFQ